MTKKSPGAKAEGPGEGNGCSAGKTKKEKKFASIKDKTRCRLKGAVSVFCCVALWDILGVEIFV